MKVGGLAITLIVPLMGLGASHAMACSLLAPPLEETAKAVALSGVVMRGTVIQRIDGAKRQPEIIHADEIYVGDLSNRTYVIYHSARDYELLRRPYLVRDSCDWLPLQYKVGYNGIFVLEPASSSEGVANGRWWYSFFGNSLLFAQGAPALVKAATQTGRFRSAPPIIP